MKDYEKVYLEFSNKTPKEISIELGRPLSTIKRWLNKLNKIPQKPSPLLSEPKEEVKKPSIVKGLFHTKTDKGKKFGVVMTKAASEASDAAVKNNNLKTNKNNPVIHRMFEE